MATDAVIGVVVASAPLEQLASIGVEAVVVTQPMSDEDSVDNASADRKNCDLDDPWLAETANANFFEFFPKKRKVDQVRPAQSL